MLRMSGQLEPTLALYQRIFDLMDALLRQDPCKLGTVDH